MATQFFLSAKPSGITQRHLFGLMTAKFYRRRNLLNSILHSHTFNLCLMVMCCWLEHVATIETETPKKTQSFSVGTVRFCVGSFWATELTVFRLRTME